MLNFKVVVATSLGLLVALSALAKDVVIDVRSEQEFQAGHVDGALNIPHTAIGQDILKTKVAKDDHVILYCQTGRRSGIALETLKGIGFSNAENYGGIDQARKRLQKP
ncbi:rhodanese-like domain-containing protein [Rhodoferax sp. GW822-FHT02A01]|uniref:rhodanese-like domain-containing protein n=1 Tax=Rhodoferax sp. GW822-FHT02A01 TaxID=3141537 RepID=UPI00315DFF8E